jgi:hypothetical protein
MVMVNRGSLVQFKCQHREESVWLMLSVLVTL